MSYHIVAMMTLLIFSSLSLSSAMKMSFIMVEVASLPQNKSIGYVVYVLADMAINAIKTVGDLAE